MQSYPIASRSGTLKKFKANLNSFIAELFSAARDSDIVDDDIFLPDFTSWVSAISSSTLRAFRHTATVVALAAMTSANQLIVEVLAEVQVATRQKNQERDKARQSKDRLEALEARVSELQSSAKLLDSFSEDLFNR